MAQYEIKDSYYFMKDDGIFSDEEKDLEAEYIKRECDISVLEQKYYNCSCIAGAYRLKRNEEQLRPQMQILHELYNDPETKCVDSAKIAGNTYDTCQRMNSIFSNVGDVDSYCKCVANTVARDFSRNPRLRSRYMQSLKLNALTSCRPENQPSTTPLN